MYITQMGSFILNYFVIPSFIVFIIIIFTYIKCYCIRPVAYAVAITDETGIENVLDV